MVIHMIHCNQTFIYVLTSRVVEHLYFLLHTGDGRNDSPGHSAMYCTYTLMEYDTKDIVACEVVDKRMTDMKSTNMEKEGFIRAVQSLTENGIKIAEVCTDAHPQISSLLSKQILYFHCKSAGFLYA